MGSFSLFDFARIQAILDPSYTILPDELDERINENLLCDDSFQYWFISAFPSLWRINTSWLDQMRGKVWSLAKCSRISGPSTSFL